MGGGGRGTGTERRVTERTRRLISRFDHRLRSSVLLRRPKWTAPTHTNMSEPPQKLKRTAISRPPFSLLQSVICILALQTYEPPPPNDDELDSPYVGCPSSGVQCGALGGGTLGGLSWPSQVDIRQKLVFTYGDCLLPFLLTCKAALSLRDDDDVLLSLSITPCGPLNRTPLMTAVIRNDLPLVRRMIEVANGWNLDARVTEIVGFGCGAMKSGTALTYAASLGHGEAVQALLDAKANPAKAMRCPGSLGEGLREHPDLVSKIILSDAPQDFYYSYNKHKRNALTGTYEKVGLERFPVKWSKQRVVLALEYEIPELIRTQYGAAGLTEDGLSETLLRSMWDDDSPRWKESLRAFAEHPLVSFRDRTVCAGVLQDVSWLQDLAAAASRVEFVEFVYPAAAATGAIDLVRRALRFPECDVNQWWLGRGMESILAAAWPDKHSDVVTLLASQDGIFINDALLAAANCGLTNLVQKFINMGADIQPDETNTYIATPLTAAITEGHIEAARLLIRAGATQVLDRNGNQDETPLTLACGEGPRGIVLLLLDEGADVNEADRSGVTPLMKGARRIKYSARNDASKYDASKLRDFVEIAQLLLERGAESDDLDEEDYTSLLTNARLVGNMRVVELLGEKEEEEAANTMDRELGVV